VAADVKYVYEFAEGSREMRDLLGGKGANLAEMTRVLGPERVPAGFTISTEACVAYMDGEGEMPAGLDAQVDEAMARLEQQAGKRLGDPSDPLLVSVRSGARVSMPGMLDTILNLGLNDRSAEGLAERTGNQRLDQLAVGLRQRARHLIEALRVADARDHVLALGVEQEVAGGLGRTRHLVAAESHT